MMAYRDGRRRENQESYLRGDMEAKRKKEKVKLRQGPAKKMSNDTE